MSYSQEELEKLLIGSILVDSESLAGGCVDIRDIKTEPALDCYNAADRLFRERRPVNIQTVVMEAGIKYASYLAGAYDKGLKSNFRPISEEIKKRAVINRLSAGVRLISERLARSEPDEVINSLRDLYNSEIINGAETGTIDEALAEFDKQSDKYAAVGNIGVTTGFTKWDDSLITYEPGHLWVMGGFTSVGKTAASLEFTGRIGANKGLAIFSLEMTKPQIISRMLSRETGYSSRFILAGKLNDKKNIEEIARAKQRLASKPLFIFRRCREWSHIVNACRMLKMQGLLDCAIFDYAQNIKTAGGSKFEQADNLARGAQDLVQDLEITGIMLSQISQQQNRDDSGSAEFKGGGGLAEVADIALHLSRPSKTSPELLVEMRKNRHGPRVDLLLEYQDHYTRLEEKA